MSQLFIKIFELKYQNAARWAAFWRYLLLFPVVGNDDPAAGLHTGGVGSDAGDILQSGVDHMTLIGIHGLQSDAVAVLDHLGGHLVGQMLQALFTAVTVVLGIQLDANKCTMQIKVEE